MMTTMTWMMTTCVSLLSLWVEGQKGVGCMGGKVGSDMGGGGTSRHSLALFTPSPPSPPCLQSSKTTPGAVPLVPGVSPTATWTCW